MAVATSFASKPAAKSALDTRTAGVHTEAHSRSVGMQHLSVRARVVQPYLVTSFRTYSESRNKASDGSISLPNWDHAVYASARKTEKKSVFMAHASCLSSPSALPTFLEELTALPTLKRATHCMYAYRVMSSIQSSGLSLGQNDGGEKGSGDRLSKLLEMSGCKNVVVVVSRWYGGVKLGSDRWKSISGVAKEALHKGGFYTHRIAEPNDKRRPAQKKAYNKKNK